MSRAVTGGYDVCLETSAAALNAQAAPALQPVVALVQGRVVDLVSPPGGPAVAGTLRLLVTGADILPAGDFPDGRIDLRLRITAGLAISEPADDQAAVALEVRLPALPVTIPPPDASGRSVWQVDPTGFTLALTVAQPVPLVELAGRLGIPDAALREVIRTTLGSAVSVGGPIPLPGTPFLIAAPGSDGSLLPPVRWTAVTLATRPTVACVLGNVLASSGPGSSSAKTRVATERGMAASLTVLERALQHDVFCPVLLRSLLPAHLDEALDDGALDHVRPDDIPDFDDYSDDDKRTLRTALRDDDVITFFSYVLPGGVPPASYLPGLGAVAGKLPARARHILGDTAAAVHTLLPSECGTARHLQLPYSRLTSLRTTLVDGAIAVAGRAEPDVWGVGGSMLFSSRLLAFVAFDGTVSIVATPPEVDSDIHLEWYAVVITAIIGALLAAVTAITGGAAAPIAVAAGAIGAAGGIGIAQIIERAVQVFAVAALVPHLTDALSAITVPALPALPNTVPAGIDIRPGELTVQLRSTGVLPRPTFTPPAPSLRLTVSTEEIRVPAGSGTVKVDNACVRGTFHYDDVSITTYVTLTAVPTNVAEPVTYTWSVDGQPLTGTTGVIEATDSSFNTGWSLSDDGHELTVWNARGSDDYFRLVDCAATGDDGLGSHDAVGAQFHGHERIMPPEYTKAVATCLRDLAGDLGKVSDPPQPVRGTGPVSRQDLLKLLNRFRAGSEYDPRAVGLLAAVARLADIDVTWLAEAARTQRTALLH
jgi:hypothetical protein